MKLAIIGSRGVEKFDFGQAIEEIPSVIITGGAKGVDTLAEEFAKRFAIECLVIKPDYKSYGRNAAPMVRNREIVDSCDSLLAVWDGKSKGTKYTIDYAKRKNKPVKIILV